MEAGDKARHNMDVGLKKNDRASRTIGKRGSFERKFDGGGRQIGLLLNKRKLSNEGAGFLRKGPFSCFRYLKEPEVTSKRLADSFSLSFFILCQTLLWYPRGGLSPENGQMGSVNLQ